MKIDIVYTWVDGSDPNWNRKRNEKAKSFGRILNDANNNARFMDNEELKYSLRSVHKFAPWINKIFIVTDNQIPEWLNTSNEKIQIVDHTELFADKSVLPTFSAMSIETQIHNIKNLEEHFIYFNDDMFLGKECTWRNFFIKKGMARIYVSEFLPLRKKKLFDINKRSASKRNVYQHAIVNTRNLVLNRFNRPIYYNIRHGIKPLLKSVLRNLEVLFRDEYEKTSRNSFRNENDILPPHLFCYFAIIKKMGKVKYLKTVNSKKSFLNKYTFGYINLHEKNIEESLNNLYDKKPFNFCLNQTPETPSKNIEMIKDFLIEYFPEKSPFEI